jgi:hypothetical protein
MTYENRKGRIHTFRLVNNATWTALPQLTTGWSGVDEFGQALEISGDGQRMVVGWWTNLNNPASSSTGYAEGKARVYTMVGDTWVQLGQDINGLHQEEYGRAVSMSR